MKHWVSKPFFTFLVKKTGRYHRMGTKPYTEKDTVSIWNSAGKYPEWSYRSSEDGPSTWNSSWKSLFKVQAYNTASRGKRPFHS